MSANSRPSHLPLTGTILLLAITAATGLAQLPAFPGAEGFGANTKGGRGGELHIVSNLDDSGPGSFRAACEAKGARTIVFRVSGLIDLKKAITVTEPYLTIAGQSAPGDGICLQRSEFKINTHDVIVRCLRSRPGDISGKEMDAMDIGGDAHDVIFDHCSANWSVDECLSPSGAISNITVQWCLIGEALNQSVHKKGAHGYGSLVRGVGGLTLHHNLWVDNNGRNPRLGDAYGRPPFPVFDLRNNVMYNWGHTCSGLTGDELSANYVANYLRPGPSSSKNAPIALASAARVGYFVQGNVVEGRPQYSTNAAAMLAPAESEGRKLFTLVNQPFAAPPVKTTSAEEAYRAVLAHVGAVAPARDTVDERIIQQVKTGTGRIIDSQKDVGGWPQYRPVETPKDSDSDGTPDAWETAHGLNPNDPTDAPKICSDGYTNLEKYLNSLIPPAP